MEYEIGPHEHDGYFYNELQKLPSRFERPPKKINTVLVIDGRLIEFVDAGTFGSFTNEESNDFYVLERVRKTSAGPIPKLVGCRLLEMRPFSYGYRNEGEDRNKSQDDEHHSVIDGKSKKQKAEKNDRLRNDRNKKSLNDMKFGIWTTFGNANFFPYVNGNMVVIGHFEKRSENSINRRTPCNVPKSPYLVTVNEGRKNGSDSQRSPEKRVFSEDGNRVGCRNLFGEYRFDDIDEQFIKVRFTHVERHVGKQKDYEKRNLSPKGALPTDNTAEKREVGDLKCFVRHFQEAREFRRTGKGFATLFLLRKRL